MNRWPLLRILLTAHGWFVLVMWAAFAVISALITIGIAIFGTVDNSVWHYMGTQVSRWFLLGLGTDVVTTYFRLHLAHGRTRADFLRQLWPHIAILSIVSGLVVAIGYLIEAGAYAIFDLPQRLPGGMAYDAANQFAVITGSYVVVFLLWTLAGIMLSAAFNRNVLLGLVLIPLAFLIVFPGEVLMAVNGVPLLDRLSSLVELPVMASVGVAALAAGIGALTTWRITRDMPLRPRVA